MTTPYYIMPNNRIPLNESGEPVLINRDQFEACCCVIAGGLTFSYECGKPNVALGPNQKLQFERRMCLRTLIWCGCIYQGEFPNYTWSNFPKIGQWVEPTYVFRHAKNSRECRLIGSGPAQECKVCQAPIIGRPAQWPGVDFNLVEGGTFNRDTKITEDNADYYLECSGDNPVFISDDIFESLVENLMGDTFSGVPFTIWIDFVSDRWKIAQNDEQGARISNTYINNKAISGSINYIVDPNYQDPDYVYRCAEEGYGGPICEYNN
jgi:hypothetical protein